MIFFSLFSWNTSASSFFSASISGTSTSCCLTIASVPSVFSSTSVATGFSTFGSGFSSFTSTFSAAGFFTSVAFSATSVAIGFSFFSASFFVAGSFAFVPSVFSEPEGDFLKASRSILPNGLNCCWVAGSRRLSARLSLTGSAGFFSLFFLGKSLSAWLRISLSCWKAATKASYWASLILKLGSAFTSPKSLFFSKNSTAVWSPMFSSLNALFNLILILENLKIIKFKN